MKVGEVCLFTSDVIRLANFYKALFGIDNGSNDEVHQFILSEETSFTIYNDGNLRGENNPHICIAFTVEDIDAEYSKLQALGTTILTPPTTRPWGATNMMFLDPDNNYIVYRSFPK